MASGRYNQKNAADTYGLSVHTPVPKWLKEEEVRRAKALMDANPRLTFEDAICCVLKDPINKAKSVPA